MGDLLRFELSEEPIWAGPVTRGVHHVASCQKLSLEVRKTRGSPIGDLARMILAQTDTAPDTLIDVRRGETLCFKPQTLAAWAEITVSEPNGSSARHVKWVDMRDVDWGDQE